MFVTENLWIKVKEDVKEENFALVIPRRTILLTRDR